MLKDSLGRNITYVRISLTDRCELRCRYCMPADGIRKLPQSRILTYGEVRRIVDIFRQLGVTKFRFTGGEPFLRNGAMDFFESLDTAFIRGLRGEETSAPYWKT
jgi:cyclic pyranopterin phosphate synthase